MATCRDLSKLALRQEPAECLHNHSWHQMDVRDGKERYPELKPTMKPLERIFFCYCCFWQVWQQGGASRYPHLPNVQYGHMFCISNLINKAEYIHYPHATGGLQIIPSGVTKRSQAHRSRQSLWSWLYILTDIMLVLCSSLKPADKSHTWLYVSAQNYMSNLIHWNHFRLSITPVLSGCLLIHNILNRQKRWLRETVGRVASWRRWRTECWDAPEPRKMLPDECTVIFEDMEMHIYF